MRIKEIREHGYRVRLLRIYFVAPNIYFMYVEMDRRVDMVSPGLTLEDKTDTSLLILPKTYDPDDPEHAEITIEGDWYAVCHWWKDVVECVLIERNAYRRIVSSEPVVKVDKKWGSRSL